MSRLSPLAGLSTKKNPQKLDKDTFSTRGL